MNICQTKMSTLSLAGLFQIAISTIPTHAADNIYVCDKGEPYIQLMASDTNTGNVTLMLVQSR